MINLIARASDKILLYPARQWAEPVKAYPAASWWAFVMSCTIIMESYCIFLMGQFIATAQFAHDFGVYSENKKDFIIEASWQSAFQCSGPVGALIGVFIVGPITSRIGYRWTTIGGLMFLNAFIFIFYFGNSQGVFMAAQILEGQHGLLLSAELRGASSALQGDRPYYSGAVHPFDLLE